MRQSMIQFIVAVCFLIATVRADDGRDMINVRDSGSPLLNITEENDRAEAPSTSQLRPITTDNPQELPVQFSQTAQDSESSESDESGTNDDSDTGTGIDAEQDQEIVNANYMIEVDNEFKTE